MMFSEKLLRYIRFIKQCDIPTVIADPIKAKQGHGLTKFGEMLR